MDITSAMITFGTPAYLLLQVISLASFASGWRKAAYVPLIFAVPIALWCLAAFVGQSNIWPLPFIFFAPIGAIYLAGLLVLWGTVKFVS